jgi:hypothetical protein
MMENGRYVDNMDIDGPMRLGVKEVFEPLRYEVAWLHAKWALYSQLYCRGDEQLTFLDSVAPGFFVLIRDSLENELIVGVCRLIEAAKTGKKKNLTLARLEESLSSEQELELRGSFAARFEELCRLCSPLRKWRHRRVAHSDYPTLAGKAQASLQRIPWQTIDEALAEVRTLMNLVERHFLDAEFHYESFTDLEDGAAVVFYLREAQRTRKRRSAGQWGGETHNHALAPDGWRRR